MMYPVAEYYHVTVVGNAVIDQYMPVAEYKIIDVGVSGVVLLGKCYQRLVFGPFKAGRLFAEIAAVR